MRGMWMSKKEVRQAAAELAERLCEKDFLDRSGLSRKNVMMLMNKDHWVLVRMRMKGGDTSTE